MLTDDQPTTGPKDHNNRDQNRENRPNREVPTVERWHLAKDNLNLPLKGFWHDVWVHLSLAIKKTGF